MKILINVWKYPDLKKVVQKFRGLDMSAFRDTSASPRRRDQNRFEVRFLDQYKTVGMKSIRVRELVREVEMFVVEEIASHLQRRRKVF